MGEKSVAVMLYSDHGVFYEGQWCGDISEKLIVALGIDAEELHHSDGAVPLKITVEKKDE